MVVKLPDGGTPAGTAVCRPAMSSSNAGGVSVTSTEQFQSLLRENGEAATDLQVRREGESMTLSVSRSRTNRGTTVSAPGSGTPWPASATMTYYDPDTGAFGALGHGITDTDTALLMPFASGSILPLHCQGGEKGRGR